VTSTSPVAAWQRRYATQVTQVAGNVGDAQRKLQLATTHLGRARTLLQAKEFDLALMNAELALVVSADAVLLKDGFDVGSHVARLAYPLLPGVFAGNTALIWRIRTARNAAQYEAAGNTTEGFARQAVVLANERSLR
jgi:hypothetical protein